MFLDGNISISALVTEAGSGGATVAKSDPLYPHKATLHMHCTGVWCDYRGEVVVQYFQGRHVFPLLF